MNYRFRWILLTSIAFGCGSPSSIDSGMPAVDAADGASLGFDALNGQDASIDGSTASDAGVCPMNTSSCGAAGCVDTRSDNSHCGSCGNVCPMQSHCESGVCTCPVGATLCDGSCVNLQTNPTHCGACGMACSMGEFCVDGACRANCPMPNQVCGVGPMMLCTNTLSDPANCGGCGVACPANNASARCSMGMCAIASCNAGFADCDMASANGCEVNTRSDVANCGACGAVCTAANGTAVCQSGSCAVSGCSAGFANCDMNAANGCEINTGNDSNNCGACGVACGAGRSCQSGVCVCDAGTTMCGATCVNTNTNPAHCGACNNSCPGGQLCVAGSCQLGCPAPNRICGAGAMMTCVNTQTDLSHCGGCGTSCSVANATAACTAGTCGVASCNAGFANCDMNAANGCEIATTTNLMHCGACGVQCPPRLNAASSCSAGVCGIGACSAGFGNCDLNAVNGCEVMLSNNISHCGACGNACSAPNATPSCVNGSCAIASCNAGFANCDMNAANGCETTTSNSIANCGACGNVCPGDPNGSPVCSMGTCSLNCSAGYFLVGGRCVSYPRPVAPISLGDTTLLRPTLRWVLPAGIDGALVELCRDRACTMVIETIRALGSSTRPTMALPAGTVVFWRMRGTVGASTAMNYSPTWLFHTPVADATSGVDSSSHPHLDVNADGYDDVLVGAPLADSVGRTDVGAVSVFHGAMAGIPMVAARVLEGAAANDGFGSFVANAGDVNGDGFADVIVGAEQADPGGRAAAGTATVFLGSAGGILPMPNVVLEGVGANDRFGRSVATAGDVNGDGFADVIVGAPFADPGGVVDAGTATIFPGSAAGLQSTPMVTLLGLATLDGFGSSVSSAGDVNGDRLSDVIVGAFNATFGAIGRRGSASIFHGAMGGVTRVVARTYEGPSVGSNFGIAVAGAGDLNNDGYSDLVVGAPGANLGTGGAYTYHGSNTGASIGVARGINGVTVGDQFGASVSRSGDIRRTGFGGIIVGAMGGDLPGRAECGFAYVYVGSATGIPAMSVFTPAGLVAGDGLGNSVSSAGDINRDGYADFSMGAALSDPSGRTSAGTVHIYHGRAGGFVANPDRRLEGVAIGDAFGSAVANVRTGSTARAIFLALRESVLAPHSHIAQTRSPHRANVCRTCANVRTTG